MRRLRRRGRDPGLKTRSNVPKDTEVDHAATLESLLAKNASSDWSTANGATVEGVVVQVEREEDGDTDIPLALKRTEKDTPMGLIVEVTPAWAKMKASLSHASLKKLVGSPARATGWLFYEPDDVSADPRGTSWENFPATEISAAK